MMVKMEMTATGYPLRGAPGVAHAMVAAKLPVELLVIEVDFQPLTVDFALRGF